MKAKKVQGERVAYATLMERLVAAEQQLTIERANWDVERGQWLARSNLAAARAQAVLNNLQAAQKRLNEIDRGEGGSITLERRLARALEPVILTEEKCPLDPWVVRRIEGGKLYTGRGFDAAVWSLVQELVGTGPVYLLVAVEDEEAEDDD